MVQSPSTNQLLDAIIKKQQYFEKALLNSRVRKAIDYVHNYRSEIRSPFEGGDIISVEPLDKFGVYEIRRDQAPTAIPPQIVHLTADFTQSLGPLAASTGKIQAQMTTLDVNLNEIAIYKILPADFGYRFEFNQPAQQIKFGNKLGSWNFSGADLGPLSENPHFQGLIPEVMVFADKTPITITAYSEDPNTTNNYWVRAKVYGYQYVVKPLDDVTIQNNDPRVVASIWVGTPQK